MKVLSLFDGMSCGRIALDQLGIPVEKYYASEIDKYAIKVSQANYPDIIQVGDVCDLDPKDFKDVNLILFGSPCQGFSFAGKQLAFDDPRSKLFFEAVRLLKAIKPKYFLAENVRMKKEFLQIFTEQLSACYDAKDVAPQFVDLVGNVRFEPIFINSSLVSAQSRQRYYWTNIPGVKQPEERGIVLRDILETEPDNFTTMSDKFVKRNGDKNCMIDQNKEKAHNLSAMEYVKNGRQGNYLACDDNGKPTNKPKQVGKIKDGGQGNRIYSQDGKSSTLSAQSGGTAGNGNTLVETKPKQVGTAVDINGHDILKRVYSPDGKSPTVNTCQGGNREPKVAVFSKERVEKFKETMKDDAIINYIQDSDVTTNAIVQLNNPKHSSGRVYSTKGKSPTLMAGNSGGGKEPVKIVTGGAIRGRAYDKDGKRMDKDGVSVANKTTQMLELRKDDKSNAITTVGKDSVVAHEDLTWRKLTPLECERLQTVPDNYTNHVSNTQRYKMLGNGFTCEVIKHIFKNMEI